MNVRSIRLASGAMPIAFFFLAIANPAMAQFTVSLSVNENGIGTFRNSAGFSSPLPFSFLADPGPGGLSIVGNYGLLNPPGLTRGDVLLTENSGGALVLSDLLRFDPVTGNGSLFFYSALTGGADSLLDKGLPTSFSTNLLSLPEVSLGALGVGAVYTPLAGQPGFVAGAGGPVTYTFISQPAAVGTPEPSTIALSGCGLAFALWAVRRKQLALR